MEYSYTLTMRIKTSNFQETAAGLRAESSQAAQTLQLDLICLVNALSYCNFDYT